ncbi:MAG: long-chain fatty acid--CoA ligase [Actinomycetota bacterium]|nr:long-chain fatty acid--CoA ligase [Actinomycetota bacterium]
MAQTQARTETGTRTIARLWQDAVSANRSGPAYLVERDGGWHEVSWAEAAQAVDELAHGLLAIGIGKGDSFAILGSTTLDWALFDFALASIGAVAAPIYANSSPADCAHVLENSDAVGVLVEDEAQRAKVAEVPLEHVYSFGDLDGLRARGREHAAVHPRAVEEAAAAIDPEDLFTFIYTSGTTGPPKGCMIRHRNYYAMCQEAAAANDVLAENDVILLFLPLAHNFGRLVHLLGPYLGFTIAFCPDPLKVAEALPVVRPTVFPSVPRLYEKVHTGVTAAFDAETGAKRRIVDWALRVGKRVSDLRQRGEPVPRGLAAQHRLANRLVYSKVKARLGGRLRVGISGGAPLSKEILEFFHMLDILILEGYGLTECTTAATVNRMNRFRFGTVGLPYDGVELKLADDGEILIRTETVFGGYYKDEQATREVLGEDGWLRSGDIGSIDEDGFLTITDRKKDILVTAGGKNVAPQNLENALKSSRYVSQALVVGDRRPYVAALITLDETDAPTGDAREAIQGVVDGVNANLSRYEQIKRFEILPRDFSAELGEVTPTLKLKRRVCEEHFSNEIDGLYS